MPRLRSNRLRIGRFQFGWRHIAAAAPASRAALVLPGGPGLSSGYLASWSSRLAREADLNAYLIEYPLIAGGTSLPAREKLELLKDSLAALFKKFAGRGKPVLIGHSFSCRLLLELLRTRDVPAGALILLNCPERFDEGSSFARAAKRLRLPERIDSEDRFAVFWRRILPLYFGVPAKSRWVRALVRDTAWMESAWLADAVQGKLASLPKSVLPPTLFLSGGADRRFPRQNAALLRKLFPRSAHAVIPRAGHFPMLEAEKESAQEAVLFLDKIRCGVGQ